MIINMNGAKAPETPSPVMQEKTVTPETLPVVIGADEGYDGLSQVTVNPDAQLKAENIRSGKSIFGVEGVFTGEVQLAGGIPFNDIWTGSDNRDSIVLYRFTSDEIVASTTTPPGTAYGVSYGINSVQPIVSWIDSVNLKTMGRFSPITNKSTNASWWGSHGQTPEVTIPAQTASLEYHQLGTSNDNKNERILLRMVAGVARMVSSTDKRVYNSEYAANESLVILDMEIDAPYYDHPVTIDIPEMTFPVTQVYTTSDSYAVVMCPASWTVIS